MTNAVAPAPGALHQEILDAMPIGVAVFGADQRLLLMNAAYYRSLDLPPGSFPPGTTLEETMRQAAYRGVFGPGDPEQQFRQQLLADRSRSGRLRRRRFQGRSYDLFSTPLASGGHLVNAVETTSLVEAREAAEAVAAQTVSGVSALRIGLAGFDAAAALILFNPRFSELLSLPTGLLNRGMRFPALLDAMRTLDEYIGFEGEQFLAAQAALDRTHADNARRLRINGQVIDIASAPLPDGGWTITLSDVTPLARAEDELHRRVVMLDVLLEAIPHGICVYGADGRVRMFNHAYATIMRGAEVSVGDHRDEVLHRRVAAGEYGPLGMAALHHSAADLDFTRAHIRPRRQRPNGIFIDVRIAPLPDGGHVLVVTDTTQLAAAEAALARHAAEMEAMLTHSRHGIVLWAADKTLLASNQIAAELLEMPPEMLTRGLREHDLLTYLHAQGTYGPDPAAAQEYLTTHLAHDRSQPLRNIRPTPSGRILEIRSNPVPGGGYVLTLSDITDMRRAEQELRAAATATDEANTAKARFLATMSHELRTPLNSVIGFSDTLMRDRGTTAPAQVREYALDINSAGKRLLMLINNMLDVARIEAGRFDLGTDRIDLRRIVQSCLRQHRNGAAAAEIELLDDLPARLPLLRGDERRMQQVLNNLLSNAIKFTEPGGSVTLSTEIGAQGDLLLRVSDTGIGIPADKIPLVFEPFTQIDSGLARRYEGSGLGLYFSRALVQAHGGTLSLHSLVGQGTTAEIHLPAHRLDAG